jgi:hypothetical protein
MVSCVSSGKGKIVRLLICAVRKIWQIHGKNYQSIKALMGKKNIENIMAKVKKQL